MLALGASILAGSVDGTLRRWDVRMGRAYADTLHHPVSALAATHDGLCALAACLDSCLRLIDVAVGELLATYSGHKHANVRMGCALLADDRHVVGCSEDGACTSSDHPSPLVASGLPPGTPCPTLCCAGCPVCLLSR